MRRWATAATLVALLGVGGCELILGIDDAKNAGGNGGEGDAGIDFGPDAAPPRGDGGTSQLAVLGLPCGPDFTDNGFGGECPPNATCLLRVSNFSDPDGRDGYCSPLCDGDNAICQSSYAGPPATPVGCILDQSGFPVSSPDTPGVFCAIACADADPQCPDQLVCFNYDDGMGGMVAGCGGSTWVMDPVLLQ